MAGINIYMSILDFKLFKTCLLYIITEILMLQNLLPTQIQQIITCCYLVVLTAHYISSGLL